MNMNEEEMRDFRLVKAAEALAEHFDHVQIFVSFYEGGDDGGTSTLVAGKGNLDARYGQVKAWVLREEEKIKETARNVH
jgi:hypothetical protein